MQEKYCVKGGSNKLQKYIRESEFKNSQCLTGKATSGYYYIDEHNEWQGKSITEGRTVVSTDAYRTIVQEYKDTLDPVITELKVGTVFENSRSEIRTIISNNGTKIECKSESGRISSFTRPGLEKNINSGLYKLIHNLNQTKNEQTSTTSTDINGKRTATAIFSNPTRQIASGSGLAGNAKTTIIKKTRIGRFEICKNAVSF